jgi:hypothetical protein
MIAQLEAPPSLPRYVIARQIETLKKEIVDMRGKSCRIAQELKNKETALSRLQAQFAISAPGAVLPHYECPR